MHHLWCMPLEAKHPFQLHKEILTDSCESGVTETDLNLA